MDNKKWGLVVLVVALLALYNGAQPDLQRMRTMGVDESIPPHERTAEQKKLMKERYGPSLAWVDRLRNANADKNYVKLNFNVLSSMMVAGLASGFKSQVASMLWMKSDEYWHKGLLTRQVPIMEAVVTLDPQFIDAWSTAGWHWAYNIYADVALNPQTKKLPEPLRSQKIRTEQERDIRVGLDYLKRGSEMNPDTYRLWFEWGWTRAEKAGLYDEETIDLFRRARAQGDARTMTRTVNKGGKSVEEKVEGIDIIGRTIGHIYEKIPDIDKALDQYGRDLLHATPQELALLDAVGEYWRRYGTDYGVIATLYQSGDAPLKAQIKRLVPDVERLVQAHAMRQTTAARPGGDQPTGAYVSIAARYVPAWRLMKQGNLDAAITQTLGEMNVDPRYHLTHLPALAEVFKLRGDAPNVVRQELDASRKYEKESSQDIGLHFLARLYEMKANRTTDQAQKMALLKKAYETWYRSRERDTLDYYARANTTRYEDAYNFTPPQAIIEAIKKSRTKGSPDAAPPLNVPQYQNEHPHHEGDETAPS